MRSAEVIDLLFKHGKLKSCKHRDGYAYYFSGHSYGVEMSSEDYRGVLNDILTTVKTDLWVACKEVEDESK